MTVAVGWRERLQLGHVAWRYTARAALVTLVIALVLRNEGVPAGSVALPAAGVWLSPIFVVLGNVGFARTRGTNVQLTSAGYVVILALVLTLPPLHALLIGLATETAYYLIRRQPLVKLAFNVSSSAMQLSCTALTLHLLDGGRGTLSATGVFVAWAALVSGELQQWLHTEPFLISLGRTEGTRRPEPFFQAYRVESIAEKFVIASAAIVTLRGVRADGDLWWFFPMLLLAIVLFSLSVGARQHHRIGTAAERQWLLLSRSEAALASLPALATAARDVSRADGVRIVLRGETAVTGTTVESGDQTTQSGIWSRLAAYGPNHRRSLRAEIRGGSPGDHIVLYTASRADIRLQSRLEERVVSIADEISLALARESDRAELERAATHDVLTGLLRPAVFTERFDEALARWGGATVMLVQVGRLRQVNDLFGRAAGDELLRSVAGNLSSVLSEGALTCRLGGHLFAAAVPFSDHDQARLSATLLSRVLLRGDTAGSTRAALTIGVALAPHDGTEAGVLIRRAELGLDVAYAKGELVGFFTQAVEDDATRKLGLVTALRGALEQGAVTAVYQPQVAPDTGRIVGVEALARWTDPAFGFVPPDEFIVLAESSGLIQPLTETILRTALQQCSAWAEAGLDIPMSVNLSARSLTDPGIVPLVAQLLVSTGVPACKLTLEVTETAVMDDPSVAINTLHELRALGAKVSLDDFGTGHSSLAYLRTLPADEVKLDRAFTSDLGDPAAMALVKASVELAHALGLTIVAEGVEDQPSLDVLRGLGVDVAQGYHLCRPGTPEAIAPFLHSRCSHSMAA